MANALGTLFQDIANAIRSKTGETGSMKPIEFPDKIISIEAGSGALVKYVTFMDGDVELFKMPVLSGDDCKDPITHGDINIPTKESTNTTNYTYSGWSMMDGGSADESALKNVTEDRVVYATFTSSVRYYTVNFYDNSELLYTEEVTYGGSVEYTPAKKDGYSFDGWQPSNMGITSNTDCYAQWIEGMRLKDYTWAEISTISKNGLAAETFAIGAEKTFELKSSSRTITAIARIIGFNHDVLSDGSGKAGITFEVQEDAFDSSTWVSNGVSGKYYWGTDANSFGVKLDSYILKADYIPQALINVIKAVDKAYYDGSADTVLTISNKLWFCSMTELGFDTPKSNKTYYKEGETYEIYSSGKTFPDVSYDELVSPGLIQQDTYGKGGCYHTRSKFSGTSSLYYYYINAEGAATEAKYGSTKTQFYKKLCFCV